MKRIAKVLSLSLLASTLLLNTTMSHAAHDKTRTEPSKEYAGKNLPLSAVPVPREAEWVKHHQQLAATVKKGDIDVVFYGDSITDWMNVDLLHKIIGPKATNIGIAGDCTEHLLWRLQNGEMDFAGKPPRAAVVLIGTNNLPDFPGFHHSTNDDVLVGVKACLTEIQKKIPKILLLGILPRDQKPNTELRNRLKDTNELLKTLADNKHVFYADIGPQLLDADGTLSTDVMYDFLHPSKDTGYQRMLDAIKPHLDKVLAAK